MVVAASSTLWGVVLNNTNFVHRIISVIAPEELRKEMNPGIELSVFL